ncbi:MAG: chitobiase/beta-hexosaminidase C-terminal domain-containing protein [Clostridia bacterium]|nr:chitobiase/beta-hexosaminidase C-terminal domain-containing protein [Clostridia bacterium]
MADEALNCDHCGTLLSGHSPLSGATGVRAIRQGRMDSVPPVLPDDARTDIPEYGDYDMSPLPLEQERGVRRKVAPKGLNSFASRPSTHRGIPVNARGLSRHIGSSHARTHAVKRHPVNWMLVSLLILVLVILAAAGYWVYMSGTDEGQRTTARRIVEASSEFTLELASSKDDLRQKEREDLLGNMRSAPAQAYWLVGQEFIDKGDLDQAIMSFRLANILDPESYDGLLLLANAYELNNDSTSAEKEYLTLCETVAPSRTEAYTALIRMYQDQERNPDAANMMLQAYENTDRENFRVQRKDFIPNIPQVDLPAGRHMLEQTVHLTSPQGYDIYYTLDNGAVLPEEGSFTEDGVVTIPEGTLTLRAVCCSQDLVSDPLSVTYTVFYPTPPAPKANLAPNTYTKRRDVSLRPGDMPKEKSREEKDQTYTYYYTIDGSTPTLESPVFDGTPIDLPSGRVTLRAVAVNQYGKMSSICEVSYKFDVKPALPPIYSDVDKFRGFTLNATSPDDFRQHFGAPAGEADTRYLSLDNDAQHWDYDWGHAVFTLTNNKWVLVRVEMNREITAGPRNVGFDNSEEDITSAYKDMGQVRNPNGNRGLYYDDINLGRVLLNEDGAKTVYYSCNTTASNIWVLEYHLKGNRVNQIIHYYRP